MTEIEKHLLTALEDSEKEHEKQLEEFRNMFQILEEEYKKVQEENQEIRRENNILNGKLDRLIELLESKNRR